MAEAEDTVEPPAAPPGAPRRGLERWRWRMLLGLVIVLLAGFVVAWMARERLAEGAIQRQLDSLDLPATYTIEKISPTEQVLTNIVVGDPDRPDLTIERASLSLRFGFGMPSIGTVSLEQARLYGSYRDGKLSFGSLDPLLFAESDAPPGLPAIDLSLRDGRALIETDYGPVGIKAEGSGGLDDGFRGVLAATAPDLAFAGCEASGARLFGDIGVSDGKPRFDGPIRLDSVNCRTSDFVMRDAAFQTTLDIAADFATFDATTKLSTGAVVLSDASVAGLNGTTRIGMVGDGINATFDLTADRLATAQFGFASLGADGSFRSRDSFNRIELEAELDGQGAQLSQAIGQAIDRQVRAASDGLAGALLGRAHNVIQRESPGSRLTANVTVRKTGAVLSAVIPQAVLRGGSGATLASLSRGQFSNAGAGTPRFEGNISTGGGLPVIAGRMEQQSNGANAFRLRMAEYAAGGARLAVPELVVLQGRRGAVGFSGTVEASGSFPGGAAQGLVLPVSGNWSSSGGLAMWQRCVDLRFERLELASLVLRRRGLSVCPPSGSAIVRYADNDLRIAAGAPSITLEGELAGTPLTFASGAIGVAWPGVMTVRSASVVLGPAGSATTLELGDIQARLGADIAGTFAGTNARLDAVPLDVSDAAGNWTYTGGVLSLTNARFTLTDRQDKARFEPLEGSDGRLTLEDNVIRADADLLAPENQVLVASVEILHDLAGATGHADLSVPGLRFGDRLQPDNLTYLADGVIELAEGVVTGRGRIDWNAQGVTSSGEFSTRDFDFAAAFGPVEGARGTIQFSDLLAMTTPPGQVLYVDSVNPGIEATNGVITYKLTDGAVLDVTDAKLPFLGGSLDMHPVRLDFSAPSEKRYVFEMTGVDAAQFVQRMDLENLAATGIFDGTLPLVFDEMGNGVIEQGVLISRPPGGNISYVGELTYEDMGAMANFAFAALRSLDYRQMLVEMNGPLTGEIITQVRFDGVTQGEGASSNIITRRVAKLPIRFNINIRSSFYKLFRDLQSIYDPAMSQDPSFLGLVDEDGNPLIPILKPDGTIQTPESEDRP